MQLILVCKSLDYKYFGMKQIIEPLVNELKQLTTCPLLLQPSTPNAVKLLTVLKDHLGHHSLAGISTCFSSGSICLYCNITSQDIHAGKYHKKDFQCDPQRLIPCGLNAVPGFDCVKQMLPCIAHDLLEGVVSYDLFLFLHHLSKDLRWFSDNQIQAAILLHDFLSPDASIQYQIWKSTRHCSPNKTIPSVLALFCQSG
jgi:hypothetical protein